MSDLHKPSNPSFEDHIAAQVVGGAADYPRRKRMQPADQGFSGENWDVQMGLQAGIAMQIVGWQRIFIPDEIQILNWRPILMASS